MKMMMMMMMVLVSLLNILSEVEEEEHFSDLKHFQMPLFLLLHSFLPLQTFTLMRLVNYS